MHWCCLLAGCVRASGTGSRVPLLPALCCVPWLTHGGFLSATPQGAHSMTIRAKTPVLCRAAPPPALRRPHQSGDRDGVLRCRDAQGGLLGIARRLHPSSGQGLLLPLRAVTGPWLRGREGQHPVRTLATPLRSYVFHVPPRRFPPLLLRTLCGWYAITFAPTPHSLVLCVKYLADIESRSAPIPLRCSGR